MKFTVEEIIGCTGAKVLFEKDLNGEFEISTDTRKLKAGDIYLPLRGENYDGHNFIDKALEAGALGYFTQDKFKVNQKANFVLYVENSLVAYLKLANFIRNKINPKVVAITGSSGKTTTKELLYAVFSTTFKTHKTYLNHNNEIGLCETFFTMLSDCEVLIVEMGMRNLGEIELLSNYSKPDIGIISNVGTAHVERLGTVKNIAIAKCEIVSGLKTDGVFISPNSDRIKENIKFSGEKIFTDFSKVSDVEIDISSSKFVYEGIKYELNIAGEYNIENALLVIEAAKKLGIKNEDIKKGLLNFKSIEKRWEQSEIKGLTFINDSYNANPESMKAVLKTFLSIYKKPLVLVLGNMGELGKDEIAYHKEIGEFLCSYKDIKLLTVGNLAKYILRNSTLEGVEFETNFECAKYILDNIEKGSTVLLKASRAMKFEEIIEMVGRL